MSKTLFFLGGDADAPKGGGEVGRGEVGLGVRERVASRSPPVPHKEERSTRGTQEVMGGRERERERPWVRGWNGNWFRAPPFLPLPLCIGGGKVEGGGEGVGTNRISGKDNRVLSAL